MRNIFFLCLAFLLLQSTASAQWQITTGDTTFKIPVQALDDTDPFAEKIDVGSLACRRWKNGTDGACGGTTAEVSDANHPGLWQYTPAAGDVDTAGPLIFRFTATGMKVFRSANQVGIIASNLKQVQGVDVPGLYNGVLVSVSGTNVGVAAGHVIEDDQFNNGVELVVFDSGGKPKRKSCITDSVDSGDTVITREDLSVGTAAIAAGNNYVIRPAAACSSTLFATQTFSNTGTWTGNLAGNVTGNVQGGVTGAVGSVTGAVGSVTGNVGGNLIGNVNGSVVGNVNGNVNGNVGGTINGLTAVALKDFFDTNSTSNYAAAVPGSVIKEIADNAAGAGGGTVAANVTQLNGVALAASEIPGYLPTTDAGDQYGTAQSYTSKTVRLGNAEVFKDNSLADNNSLHVFDATTGIGQNKCICANVESTDMVTLCTPFKPTPTGTLKYLVFKSPQCNLAKYPTSH